MIESPTTCPICVRQFEKRELLRTHMLVSHRRSDMVEALLRRGEGTTVGLYPGR